MVLCGLQSEERILDVRLRTDWRFVRERASGQLWCSMSSMRAKMFAMTSYRTFGVSSEVSNVLVDCFQAINTSETYH